MSRFRAMSEERSSKNYREAIAEISIRAPTERNRKLTQLLEGVNADDQLKAWWHMQQVNSERLAMSDHSWVHIQIVVNIALRLLRLLDKTGLETSIVRDHGFDVKEAEVVVTAAAMLHDTGMSIHRTDHEAYSLFMAQRKLEELLGPLYDEPERSILIAESLHAIIGHRRKGNPFTVEAGIVRVADALDMEQGRSRVPFEANRPNIHSLSAAAVDDVRIAEGEDRAVRIEIDMNNSSGIFQVDELLATKLRGSGLEDHVEVIAKIEAEHEKRLVPIFRI
jgi:metal-dependent HD superfamily phosphatase/phosphodiesterase